MAVCCAAVCGAAAQDVPHVRNFQPADYGAQNQNWSITQSREGWIYVGNNGGLLEFDGASWRQFSMPEKQTVRAVAAGRNGEIFCGGFAEFGFWQPNSGGNLAYTSLSNQVRAEHLEKEEIWHILPMPDYVLFQSFSTIYKYDYQKITVVKPPNSIMFARVVEGRVFIPVIGRGVYELLPDNTFRFVEGTETLKDKIVQFLVGSDAGNIWAGTTNHGIFEIGKGKCTPWSSPLNAEFSKYQLNKALALKNGGWAIGTILNGAYILDKNGEQRFHLHRENGLQNNTVLALREDEDNNLWIGLDRGIDLAGLRSPLVAFTDQTGRIGTVYTAAEAAGFLYIGTNQGVFARPAGDGTAVENAKFELIEGTQGQVWQLQNFDGQLLCGHNAGTFLIQGNRARKISDVTGGWCTTGVPGMPGMLLQSTYTGLVLFQKNGNNWMFSRRIGGFSEPLKKIAFDGSGNIWGVHPNKGLSRLQLNDSLTQVREIKTYSKVDGLPKDFHLDIASINNHLIINTAPAPLEIVGVNGGYEFRVFSTEFARQKLLPGNGNDFFIVDSSGIRFRSGARTTYFPLKPVPQFENVVSLSDKRYLICLENGFAILDNQNASESLDTRAHPVVIRWMETAAGIRLPITESIEIPWSSNNIKLYFSSPFFEREPKFSWRLDGFSDTWSAWQPMPEKEFTNLPSGSYTFRVRSDMGGPETMLRFRIMPPWYRSVWALGIYALLLAAAFWGMEKYNRLRLEKQRKHLENEKRRELEQQRNEAEREKLLLEVENKTRELSNAALNLIRKNEILQHLKDDLLKAKTEPRILPKIIRLIDEHLEGDHDWDIFEESFNRVHDDFFKRLMHDFPDLTPGDLRLAAYLKMNLSSKEIAPLLNISVRGVENKRYRLRKKLGLAEDANLTEFIMNF